MELTTKHHIGFLFILIPIVLFFSRQDSESFSPTSSAPIEIVTYAHAATTPQTVTSAPPFSLLSDSQPEGKYEYLEVTGGCDHGTDLHCIWAYAGPSTDYEKVYQLEKGMLLTVVGKEEIDGQVWYHIQFDGTLRHPERTMKDWYIPSSAGRIIHAGGIEMLSGKVTTNKRIVVDLSDQKIYAYEGDQLFMATKVSTGERETPTPLGAFTIFKKMPSRYMQGPIPGVTDVPFDLPGVSWDMYFTEDGAAIHGTYWHNDYGTTQSDGCVNLPPELAKILYAWAPLGTTVTVQN